MNKPNQLIQLLDNLREDAVQTTVVTVKNSTATIYLTGEPDGLVLNAEECERLLDTPETVQQLFEALDEPIDASVELYNVTIDDEVMDALSELFGSVDHA